MKTIIVLFLLMHHTLNAAVTVGSSPGFGTCDYLTIQEAIDSDESEIRVLNNSSFTETLSIDRSVEIRGGYSSCLTAQLNVTNGVNSTVKANDAPIRGIITDRPVLEIMDSMETLPIVKLYDLTLKDAILLNGSDKGRGIDIGDSNVHLKLFRVMITNNIGNNGAGIFVGDSDDTTIELEDSSIIGNTATMDGGGLYCSNANTNIIIRNNSDISSNQAENGGGIYATSGCNVISECLSIDAECPNFSNNSATQFGGGLYASLTAKIDINQSKIFSNKANIGTFAYVNNIGTKLILNNDFIYSNGSNGVENNDYYVMVSNDQAKIEIKHSTIVDNEVNDLGSILGMFSNSKISLKNSIVHNNDDILINGTDEENFTISCVIANETTSVSGVAIVLEPEFIDRANHDYHLSGSSKAIDFCPPLIETYIPILTDIDGESRPWDDNQSNDFFGIADAGADETYINDQIFKNGFE